MNIKTIFEDANSSDKVPELILSFKRPKIDKRKLDTTEKQVEFLREIFDPNTFEIQEEMILLILNDSYQPVCYYHLAKSLPGEVAVSYQLIFSILISTHAEGFILSHNHPHKVSFPSHEDIQSNHNIAIRASMFGIPYIDSIIIGSIEETEDDDPGYFSLRDNGLFFNGDFE